MASQKFISMGFLVLISLSLSSAHRFFLDTIDDNKPKESISNLPGSSDGGSGSGFGVGQGSGSGAGRSNGVGAGYGSGSGRGVGQGHGKGYGDGSGSYGSGFGEGWGHGGGPNYPEYGSPGLPPPQMGFGGYPEHSRPCPCSCNCGCNRLQSYTNSRDLEREISGGIGEQISSNTAKGDPAVHQARSGTFEFVKDGEPAPPEASSGRSEMEDQTMRNDSHMVVDDPRN